jgi:hypothetical protein
MRQKICSVQTPDVLLHVKKAALREQIVAGAASPRSVKDCVNNLRVKWNKGEYQKVTEAVSPMR